MHNACSVVELSKRNMGKYYHILPPTGPPSCHLLSIFSKKTTRKRIRRLNLGFVVINYCIWVNLAIEISYLCIQGTVNSHVTIFKLQFFFSVLKITVNIYIDKCH